MGVVYLTERLVEEGNAQDKLIPVVAYPESAGIWSDSLKEGALLPPVKEGDRLPRLRSESLLLTQVGMDEEQLDSSSSLLPGQQIVLPLMHEGVLMGLLVTSREDRAWNDRERYEIEKVAQTLTSARLLDRQREWLQQQLNQQQRLQAQQRDLLDNLLHQFRNPLTAMRTFGKLLLKRLLPGDANRAVADNIVRESDRLQELLQQFDRALDLTVADLDRIKSLPPAPAMDATAQAITPLPLLPNSEDKTQVCVIADVLKPLLASAWAIAQERNLELQADIVPQLPPVRANAQELREVLSNLLDNALKYTPAGGQIYVQAGLEKDDLQGIAIGDTGTGIPPEDLEHIFERHYRGVQAESEIPGTGLGLAIAKDLVEQMQGEIQVFSPALKHPNSGAGQGTTFVVWLKKLKAKG